MSSNRQWKRQLRRMLPCRQELHSLVAARSSCLCLVTPSDEYVLWTANRRVLRPLAKEDDAVRPVDRVREPNLA